MTTESGGALVVIDGREVGRSPLPTDVPLDPGPHLLLVDRGDGSSPFTRRFEATAGATMSIAVVAAGSGAAAGRTAGAGGAPNDNGVVAPGDRRRAGDATITTSDPAGVRDDEATSPGLRGRAWKIGGIATASAGALLAGGGLLFGLSARSASNDVSRNYTAARDSAGKRAESLQWVGYGLGAAAVAAGVVMVLHGANLESSQTAAGLQASVTPGGVWVEGHF